MIVRLRGITAEENIARIVHRRHLDAGFAQQRIRVSARRSPEGIKDNLQPCLLDCRKLDQL